MHALCQLHTFDMLDDCEAAPFKVSRAWPQPEHRPGGAAAGSHRSMAKIGVQPRALFESDELLVVGTRQLLADSVAQAHERARRMPRSTTCDAPVTRSVGGVERRGRDFSRAKSDESERQVDASKKYKFGRVGACRSDSSTRVSEASETRDTTRRTGVSLPQMGVAPSSNWAQRFLTEINLGFSKRFARANEPLLLALDEAHPPFAAWRAARRELSARIAAYHASLWRGAHPGGLRPKDGDVRPSYELARVAVRTSLAFPDSARQIKLRRVTR